MWRIIKLKFCPFAFVVHLDLHYFWRQLKFRGCVAKLRHFLIRTQMDLVMRVSERGGNSAVQGGN